MAAAEVKIQRKRNPPPGPPGPDGGPRLKDRLMADLDRILPPDAFAFAMPDASQDGMKHGIPGILIVHRGRALGLELGRPGLRLSDRQRTVFPRLRQAGMRIEVARSFAEALRSLREMGLQLGEQESLGRQVGELFRLAQKGGGA